MEIYNAHYVISNIYLSLERLNHNYIFMLSETNVQTDF